MEQYAASPQWAKDTERFNTREFWSSTFFVV